MKRKTMDQMTINILLIEDNPRDVGLIEKMLLIAKAMAFNLTHATTLAAGLAQLTLKDIDAILLDLKLADSEGLDTLTQVQAHAPETPVVVLTGLDDEASGLKAVQQGAQDYLIKDEVSGPLLQRAIRYAIERQRMAKTLQLVHGTSPRGDIHQGYRGARRLCESALCQRHRT
jgi:DNA-binding response OmpR family regulator